MAPAQIRWAPPLPAHRLIRLYEVNAAGLLDDDVLDDVGWRTWERLDDVRRVSTGRVRCPDCGAELQVRTTGRPADERVPCPGCSWSTTAEVWHRSWRHRDLNGHSPAFDEYLVRWPRARPARDRMLCIDAVVHALHVAARSDLHGNVAARNLLEGDRRKVVALLDELALGPGSAVAEGARARWQAARDAYGCVRPGSGRDEGPAGAGPSSTCRVAARPSGS